jgi:hypothetical protein
MFIQAAVAALLSKTGGAGRRRRDRTGATAEPPIEPAITITNREQCQAAVAPEHCPSPALIFARKILELSTAVADVADEVRNADNSLRNSVRIVASLFYKFYLVDLFYSFTIFHLRARMPVPPSSGPAPLCWRGWLRCCVPAPKPRAAGRRNQGTMRHLQ